MSHVCLCLTERKARDLSVFCLFFLFVQLHKKTLVSFVCLSVSHAFTDVFADAGALLPNGTTTGGFSVVFEAKEGRAIVIVSFTRRRETRREN